MAQFFYDFKAAKSGIYPVSDAPMGMKRTFPIVDTNYYQEFLKGAEGLDIFQRNSPGGTGNFSAGFTFGPDVMAADVECLARITEYAYQGGNYTNDGPGMFSRSSTRSSLETYYETQTAGSLSSNSSFIRKRVSGVTTDIASGSGGITREGRTVWYRFQVAGINLRIKSWIDGAAEPASWGQSATDSSIAAPGYFGFGLLGATGTGPNTGTRYRLHQLGFGTDGDQAPAQLPGGVRTVGGVVRNPSGDLAAGYVVRCYARSTGVLLAETLTDSSGAYTFSLSYSDRVTCLAVDQLGNQWGAPVKDLVVPAAG